MIANRSCALLGDRFAPAVFRPGRAAKKSQSSARYTQTQQGSVTGPADLQPLAPLGVQATRAA
jgi:hypothetical protein